MDIVLASKLFSPLLKDLLKEKDIDLAKEIQQIRILYASLNYSISTIQKFSNKYLGSDDYENILKNQNKFLQEFIELLTLVQTSVFLFKQAYLGRFISRALKDIESNLIKLADAVKSEADFYRKLKAKEKGTYKSFKDVRSSILMVSGILEMHQNHWSALIERNDSGYIDNDKLSS